METPTTPCFSCTYFAGLPDDGGSGVCARPGNRPVITEPEEGCVLFERNPKAIESIRTCDQWLALYGMPIGGYTEKRKQWRAPMTPASIKAVWEKSKTDEVLRLAWEVARLRDIIERTIGALEILSRSGVPEYWRKYVERLIHQTLGPRTQYGSGAPHE